ncbi:DUF84 family protein [Candidatus Dojkabacteria bacterium]|nr:DUF84 family protein [Candidatus Dojkabacteria bacterium]
MINVLITTKEKIYREAVADAYSKYFDKEVITIESINAQNEAIINNTNFETLENALELAKNGKKEREDFDYFIGIKSGIEYIEKDVFYYFWVVILHNNKIGRARSVSYSLPNELKAEIDNNDTSELTDTIMDLTNNLLTKKGILEETIILAISNLFY